MGPIDVLDKRQNGVQLQYRKGNNDFEERGLVFIRLKNRYSVRVIISCKFDIYDPQTGGSITHKHDCELFPDQLKEDYGAFFVVPKAGDKYLDPKAWGSARFVVQHVEMFKLRMALPEDPRGQTWEVYPNEDAAAKTADGTPATGRWRRR